LSEHKNGVQGNIEEGIYIREMLYKFQETKLFEDKMTLMLPEDFTDMPPEMAKLKYPMEQRPQVIKTDANGEINFTFSLLEQEMTQDDSEKMMQFFKKIIRNAQPSNVFYEEKTEWVNDISLSWFDYVSHGYDRKIYNIMYVFPMQGKLVHGVFNCALDDAANWRIVALQVMRSIKEI